MNRIIAIDELSFFKNLRNVNNYILAFLTSCIAGFVAYGFNMSNGYINGDGLVYGYQYSASAWDVGQGRWALPFFSGRFLSSWYEGILCILVLAISASIVIIIFEVNSVSAIIIISTMVATSTHFAQWQGSPYILFPYGAAFMLAIVSAWQMWKCIRNNKILHAIVGIFSLAVSMGVYQAYLPISVLLIYIKLMQEAARGCNYKELIKKCIKIFVMYASSGLVYYLCLRIQMKRYNAIATGSRGWSDVLAGNLNIFSDPIGTIKEMYVTFLQLLCIDGVIDFSIPHKIAYLLMAFLLIGLFGVWCSHNQDKRRWLLLGIGGLLIPLVVMLLMFLTDTVIPWSMFPAIIFIPVLSIVFERKISDRNYRFKNTVQWLISLCCVVLIFEAVYIGNVDYVNLQKRNQKTYAQCIRLLDRIETSEDYVEGIPILLVGSLQDTYPNTIPAYEGELKGYEAYVMDWLAYPGRETDMYLKYISYYLGVQLVAADNYAECYEEVISKKWFEEMEVFPSSECVKKYDDILVVKLGDS